MAEGVAGAVAAGMNPGSAAALETAGGSTWAVACIAINNTRQNAANVIFMFDFLNCSNSRRALGASQAMTANSKLPGHRPDAMMDP